MWVVQLRDDDGRVLDAEFVIEPDGPNLAVIMDSRSGGSGSRPPRNPDYNRALAVLLTRLGQLDAVLVDALVDSRHTRELALPELARRLIEAPIHLADVPDVDTLRRRMGAAQARIAQAPGAVKGSNTTKRIRLRLEVPGYQPSDVPHLADVLAIPEGVTCRRSFCFGNQATPRQEKDGRKASCGRNPMRRFRPRLLAVYGRSVGL